MSDKQIKTLSRRKFLSAAGLTAAGVGGAALIPGTSGFFTREANAADAKYKLRFGASVVTKTNEQHLRTGIYHFVDQVHKLTDGELQIQVVDSGQACGEATCGPVVTNGIYDMASSSPQNLGSVFPYSIAMDWPMLWGSREEYLNLLFSPASNRLYREVMESRYGVIPLFGSGEMRSIFMGKKYEDKDAIRSPAQLKGAKIRITNSEMISAFSQSLEMNPIPLAWTELLEGLRSGVVDATETWPGAATGFGMQNVLSQEVPVNFSPGYELVFISARAYNKLPDRIKEALLEASYQAMIFGYEGVKEAQNEVVGNGPQPSESSAYEQSGLRLIDLNDADLEEFQKAAGIANNEDIYKDIRAKLSSIAGTDVLDSMRQFQASVAGQPLKPQRWWA